ncbi:sugar ABC transporter substrate-binding protein [Ktedonosporobacter rubrisoli]|uniref:Sugar ABC transporter substrate-binding protein n=1 Tax=Ktedonosporobacter rubrisoli TaxID=2509675 RepID=A0A4P6K1I1_KTERU|nr:ABC transporter substrate-binding protein [Ktedonosporobacter rubrisoli]QBD81693.1 sugar ABC transporter substrate-binding protein [Ktedonosporobacter rubrisoli]
MDDLEGANISELASKPLNRREFLLGVATVAGTAALAACGGGSGSSSSTATNSASTGAKKYSIALVQGVKGDPFYVTMAKGAQAEASKQGVTLTVDGPAQFNATLQTPIVDALIAKKVDAIIIAACDKQAMIAPLQRANSAGIKIISVDTFIGNGDYTSGPVTFPLSYIGSDNEQGGKIAGEALIKAIGGKGKIYIQNVQPGISTTDQREQGCKEAITATSGAVSLAGVDYNEDSAAKSAQQTTAVLQRVRDLSGIFGTNLFSAEGAAQAVKQGQIKIANFDAPEQAITDLRNGVVDLVIAQLPGQMGQIAVQYAVDALNGNTSNIKKHVPTGYVVIDKSNVDSPQSQAAIYKSS